MSLRLRIALSNYGHTAAVKDGSVPIAGVTPDFADFPNMVEAYRRMVRAVEFDICEMAPTTYLMAKALGAPYTALPIFLMRRFHHSGILCRPDAGIKKPTDLHGKRAGVRAHSVTTAVWTRGVLGDEYGLDSTKVTWMVADDEHVTGIKLPANVMRIPAGENLANMMAKGELQAAFGGVPGIGKMGGKESGGAQLSQSGAETYPDLVDNAPALEADWFRRTGIYPLHGLVVVKDEILKAHPGLAGALFAAMSEAKNRYLVRLNKGEANTIEDRRYRDLAKIVGDPLPYGMKANRPGIDKIIDYSWQQGLIPERPSLDRVFIDPER